MKHLAQITEEVQTWRNLEKEVSSLLEITHLALAEKDNSLQEYITGELNELHKVLENQEFQLTLSGQYDHRDAIVSVHAGAGGTESQDWAQMILRMYIRWGERHNLQVQILDSSEGEEVGIKSATLEVTGKFAYGFLRPERGVHRLVRLSPFDADHQRHTSFAMVEILPTAEEETDIELNPQDLKIDFFRSSGPGGQNVQKIASAVRMTHIPTGIVVSCQNERSQWQNREFALKILRARLLELEIERRAKQMEGIRGKPVSAEWGNQIRSYVLHPYKMVKDHRTGHQTSNTESILDGNLEPFIQAYLLWSVGSNNS